MSGRLAAGMSPTIGRKTIGRTYVQSSDETAGARQPNARAPRAPRSTPARCAKPHPVPLDRGNVESSPLRLHDERGGPPRRMPGRELGPLRRPCCSVVQLMHPAPLWSCLRCRHAAAGPARARACWRAGAAGRAGAPRPPQRHRHRGGRQGGTARPCSASSRRPRLASGPPGWLAGWRRCSPTARTRGPWPRSSGWVPAVSPSAQRAAAPSIVGGAA